MAIQFWIINEIDSNENNQCILQGAKELMKSPTCIPICIPLQEVKHFLNKQSSKTLFRLQPISEMATEQTDEPQQ